MTEMGRAQAGAIKLTFTDVHLVANGHQKGVFGRAMQCRAPLTAANNFGSLNPGLMALRLARPIINARVH
jgi:hypothetical protein